MASVTWWHDEPDGSDLTQLARALARIWGTEHTLALKLAAVRPHLPYTVYQRLLVAASVRPAILLPPLHFRRENFTVHYDFEGQVAEVCVTEPTLLVARFPIPDSCTPNWELKEFFVNNRAVRKPVRVLSHWERPAHGLAREIRDALSKVPRGAKAIRWLANHIAALHPEDIGVIGPWSDELLTAYLLTLRDALSDTPPEDIADAARRALHRLNHQ